MQMPTAFPLRPSRVHEACGPGATAFAAIAGAQVHGALLWITEGWRTEVLNPVGLARFLDPARLLTASVRDQTEALAVAEEGLRDGALALVVADLTRPLDLREGRRLQLAAGQGRSTGLCLIPEGMGSNAAETRWHAAPVLDPKGADSTLLRWRLIKNKSGTLGAWDVRWELAPRRLDMVSPVAERPGPQDTPA